MESSHSSPLAFVGVTAWTIMVVGVALYLAVVATWTRLDIARSAFFGIRAPADIGLGMRSVGLAALPWMVGALLWRLTARRKHREPLLFYWCGVVARKWRSQRAAAWGMFPVSFGVIIWSVPILF